MLENTGFIVSTGLVTYNMLVEIRMEQVGRGWHNMTQQGMLRDSLTRSGMVWHSVECLEAV